MSGYGEISQYVTSSLPDASERLTCLSMLAESIERLHTCGPHTWGIYCKPRRFRLLAGNFIVLTLNPKGIWLALDKESLATASRLSH